MNRTGHDISASRAVFLHIVLYSLNAYTVSQQSLRIRQRSGLNSMTEKNNTQILPWANNALETLLLDLIAHGTEAAKIDFKAEIEANTPEQKAELLKDISAIANTYDENYEDHGFLVYGVKG